MRAKTPILQLMKQLCTCILVFCAALSWANTGHADPLAAFKNERSVLLLFSKSRSSAPLDRQIDLLRDRRSELSERDMIVLVTAGRQNTIAAIGYARLPSGAARELRKKYQPSGRALTVILVGKDDQEIARWDKVTDPQEIIDAVDEPNGNAATN